MSSKLYNDNTKKMCFCSFISIILVTLFIISPLSNFFKTSLFMKLVALLLIGYTIYLNYLQTNSLRHAYSQTQSEKLISQLNINILCSYTFTIFLGVLWIFVVKSFF